jgi:hypothetical protein
MWQRFNTSINKFESSIDKGVSWQPLLIDASSITSILDKTQLPASVAYEDEANIFTADQRIDKINPRLVLFDTNVPVNARMFRILNLSQALYFQALDDAQGAVQNTPLILNRSGDAIVGRDIYEKVRSTALGHWISVPFSASNFFANAGGGTWTVGSAAVLRNRYALIGKTLIWSFYISWFSGSNTVAGTVTSLGMTVPGGFTPAATQLLAGAFTTEAGGIYFTVTGATLVVSRVAGGNFGVTPGLGASLSLEIQ